VNARVAGGIRVSHVAVLVAVLVVGWFLLRGGPGMDLAHVYGQGTRPNIQGGGA
jgi:hypothetical protein